VLAEPTSTSLWHGIVDASSHEADQQQVVAELAAVVRAFGIDPDGWDRRFVGRSEYRGYHDVFKQDKKSLRLHPVPLGTYAIESLLRELDIEGSEDDEANIEIDLAHESGRTLQIQGEGSYWTEYCYSQLPPDDTRDIDELTLAGIDPTDLDVQYRLTFQAELLAQSDE